jgi:hypothetical protein
MLDNAKFWSWLTPLAPSATLLFLGSHQFTMRRSLLASLEAGGVRMKIRKQL